MASTFRNRAQALDAAYRLAKTRAHLRNAEASADVAPLPNGRWLALEHMRSDSGHTPAASVTVYSWTAHTLGAKEKPPNSR